MNNSEYSCTERNTEKFLKSQGWKPQSSGYWNHPKLDERLMTIVEALDCEHRLVDTLKNQVYELQSIGGI